MASSEPEAEQGFLFLEPCEWCGAPINEERRGTRFCGKKCRQTAHRTRRRAGEVERALDPGRFCYADPPYPGRARLYRDQASYAGEVDHRALVERLEAGGYRGWALSTAADALEDVLPMVRAVVGAKTYVRVCAWVKPIGAAPATHGLHNVWEPLVVVRGRQERPGKRDMLIAQPARFGGELIGRKPIAFAAWVFACLGMRPGDELVDVFPGTGIVARAWTEIGRGASASPEYSATPVRVADSSRSAEPSPGPGRDAPVWTLDANAHAGPCGVACYHQTPDK